MKSLQALERELPSKSERMARLGAYALCAMVLGYLAAHVAFWATKDDCLSYARKGQWVKFDKCADNGKYWPTCEGPNECK